MSKKMLVVLTNTAKYPTLKRATGLWLGEAVHFVEKVEKAGYMVDYVSPEGGYVPVDPHSLQMAPDLDWQWYDDKRFMTRLGTSLSPGQVKAEEYSVIYYTGGHGVMYDFAENKPLQELARKVYEKGGIVAAVCHGVAGLLNIKLSDNSLLLKGRKVTGFSDIEEQLVELDKVVPFSTEKELGGRGGEYSKHDDPWKPYVVEDGLLITGQNPDSTALLAEKVLEKLNAK
ncbi:MULTISPECIES: type 1 glutamine amidotransferase domain-containing protein [Pseudomonas]|jgi:putative intracellular protease/amidase|uniref:type 1 glutamine amidotransferase domain-containing protein n=1 Tax=Pseudomonas TaxID=286 RepID=UPI0018D70E23|nr:type 1 glutamine amidotransferase domain-containing protein [Pseudomonas putida]ELF6205452.1 type 1 glutamine amidotransferase domain-containing protein [Pseudomonas putida]MBH3415454.1 type 1 glutamine amidotransferase domain-containing protein [Pseudomonas putida]MDG9814066.1 type 1 glutamine amidotransferase domain-containing protein [Pseudomonas putida]GLO26425.1 thiazole biosynthesis protein ThiJ [Pseudomonas putida]HDS0970414.1 type 1 glutamine amidotransferase domain-containing prote